jgi:hypothetical protein
MDCHSLACWEVAGPAAWPVGLLNFECGLRAPTRRRRSLRRPTSCCGWVSHCMRMATSRSGRLSVSVVVHNWTATQINVDVAIFVAIFEQASEIDRVAVCSGGVESNRHHVAQMDPSAVGQRKAKLRRPRTSRQAGATQREEVDMDTAVDQGTGPDVGSLAIKNFELHPLPNWLEKRVSEILELNGRKRRGPQVTSVVTRSLTLSAAADSVPGTLRRGHSPVGNSFPGDTLPPVASAAAASSITNRLEQSRAVCPSG